MGILLIIVGLVLILINYIPIKKDGNSFKDMLKKQDKLSGDYDIELMSIRKDMAESILDLQKEIGELRDSIKHINNTVNVYDIKDKANNKDIKDTVEEKEDDKAVVCDINFNNGNIDTKNTKIDIIREMINSGYSDDDICRELNIGKGEVLLVRGLYK